MVGLNDYLAENKSSIRSRRSWRKHHLRLAGYNDYSADAFQSPAFQLEHHSKVIKNQTGIFRVRTERRIRRRMENAISEAEGFISSKRERYLRTKDEG
jgi:hypothetical protein